MKLVYLTDKIKAVCLMELVKDIVENRIDKAFIPYLIKLNKIEGVATFQCCTGHNDDQPHTSDEPYLSLIFDKRMQQFFEKEIQDWLLKFSVVTGTNVGHNRNVAWYYLGADERAVITQIYFKKNSFSIFADNILFPLVEDLRHYSEYGAQLIRRVKK